jgi:signal peptidase II
VAGDTAVAAGEHGEPRRSLPARLWCWFAPRLWFWLPWPLLVALDLWSKSAVFAFMIAEHHGEFGRHEVFRSWFLSFELVTWRNTGTIWGLLQDATVPLMVLRSGAVVWLLWYVTTATRRTRLQLLILSLIFAGAIGNLVDNFTQVGPAAGSAQRGVRDFLRFSGNWPKAWDFPAFNVADSCITVGAIGLILLLLREDRASARAAKQVSS